jgi:citronellol/citronellal dehydrogenase
LHRREDGGAAREARGTIYTAAEQIDKAGGQALPLMVDIGNEERVVAEAARETADKFGGIGVLINNASAICITGALDTPGKRYDLMHWVQLQHLRLAVGLLVLFDEAQNPHMLSISPPLTLTRQVNITPRLPMTG